MGRNSKDDSLSRYEELLKISVRYNDYLRYPRLKMRLASGAKLSELPAATTYVRNVKKALEGSDTEAIKSATDKLTTVFYSISEKLYSANAAGAAGAEGAAQTAGPNVDENGNVYDADYKVENDDNK